jgi:hypothetical protein
LIHLYGLARGQLRAQVRGIADAAVTSTPLGRLHAVVSEHDGPVPQTRAAALRHLEVIEVVAAELEVLPVRFGSDHRDEASLRTKLGAEHALRSALERVAGRVEFVVRADPTPGPPSPAAEAVAGQGEVGAGRAYLEQRRAVERAAAHRSAELLELVRSATVDLEREAAATVETVGRFGPERCFLVPRDAAASFDARARAAAGSDGRLVVGGPWPPFTFAVLPEGSEVRS